MLFCVSAGELPTPQRLAYLKELVQRVHQETLELDMSQRGMDPKVGVRSFIGVSQGASML
jgi:hypothetical protein